MNTYKTRPLIFVRAGADRNQLRQFGASLGGLFCAICLLMPSPAEAQCRQWDASGNWKLQQGSLVVTVQLRQNGKNISGTGQYTKLKAQTPNKGSVAGTVDGSTIKLDMDWDDGSGGLYTGVIGATGMIKGSVNIDKTNPSKTSPWHSLQPMKCADAKPPRPEQSSPAILRADPAEVQIPAGQDSGFITLTWDTGGSSYGQITHNLNDTGEMKIIDIRSQRASVSAVPVRPGNNVFTLSSLDKLYKLTVTAKASANAPPASGSSTTGPKITASPSIVTIPAGQTTGTTTLTWDAGKDHPYAEVWVQVDGGDERKIVEQGKGSRQVQVSAGKTYLYILTDSGQRLGTTTVKGK